MASSHCPGSPPRMRGIPFSTLTAEILQRITPAHAGNTYKDKAQDYVLRDHPRACGEYSAHGIRQCRYGGSPPRMRGIRFQGDNHLSQHGITPAHAGNTCRLLWQVGQCQDHPRACGEYSDAGLTQKASAGSPPRMRGILFEFTHDFGVPGITPAHAGNTVISHICRNPLRDHPRACGEYNQIRLANRGIRGSPPRMRGIRLPFHKFRVQGGITPAHAGNTIGFNFTFILIWDHPRACGEYQQTALQLQIQTGSPPRMRGILTSFDVLHNRIRITPAHAGNTG